MVEVVAVGKCAKCGIEVQRPASATAAVCRKDGELVKLKKKVLLACPDCGKSLKANGDSWSLITRASLGLPALSNCEFITLLGL